MSEKKEERKKNCKRLQNFTKAEKLKLITCVKNERGLWDLQCKEHCKVHSTNRSWKLIAQRVGKEVNECKIAWKAIRQSYRYYTNSLKKKRSGSLSDSPSLDESKHFEFLEELDFLQENSTKSGSFNSFEDALVPDVSIASEESNGKEKLANFSNGQPEIKNVKERKYAAVLESFETQKNLSSPQNSPKTTHNQGFWMYLTELTQDLNEVQMRELQKDMLQLVFKKLDQTSAFYN